MKKEIKQAIETYQCPGCTVGSDIKCFQPFYEGDGCGKHSAGTFMSGVGQLFLGMPKGFNRVGPQGELKLHIFNNFGSWPYNKFNIPTWKYLNKKGHTIVRGMSPRVNNNFLHVYLENCMDKIECLEITDSDLKNMD